MANYQVKEITFHSGTNDTVAAAETCPNSLVHQCCGRDQLTLMLNYTKGTEDGLRLYVKFLDSPTDTVEYQEVSQSIAAGVATISLKYYLFAATGIYAIDIPLNGKKYFKVYQIRSGAVAADGTFTLKGRVEALPKV